MRTAGAAGAAVGACRFCVRTGAAATSASPSPRAATLARRLTIGFRDVDDLPVGQAIGHPQALAVARRRLAGHLVSGDLGALLDDDLALALRIGLDHRDLALRVH